MEEGLEITNDLICAIERLHRSENGLKSRIRAINLSNILKTMRAHYLGLQCEICLNKRPGQRFCSDTHREYYLGVWHHLNWAWVIANVFPKAQICALCQGQIDNLNAKTIKYHVSIDHKIPISRGGLEFDRTNMQPTHFSCNSRKGARA